MAKSIEALLEDKIPEINFLTVSDPRIVPGSILESKEIDQWIGTARSVLVPPFEREDFETEVFPASLNLQGVSGSFSGDRALDLLGNLGFGLKRKVQFELKIEVSQVKVRQFSSDLLGKSDLEAAFRNLRKRDGKTFKSLKGCFLVMKSYYASQFELEFCQSSETVAEIGASTSPLDLNADIEASHKIEITKQDNIILVHNNDAIPFGVFGYEITKRGPILEI